MNPLFLKAILAILLLSCLTSFAWAIRNFFIQPEKSTPGMKLTVFLGSVFALLHLGFIFAADSIDFLPAVGAAFLYCSAIAVFWWAIAANRVKPLSACFSEEEQLHLVQHGPYRFVRHPFYCSYLLTWMAGSVATQSIWLGLTVVTMLALYTLAASKEESKFVNGPLGPVYSAYRSRTGQFLPSPRKLLLSRDPQ